MSDTNPGFVAHQVPTVAEWNGYFTGKVDASSGTANNLTLTGAILAPSIQASASYADDALAAAGGIAVGQLYHSGSAVRIRQSYVFTLADTATISETLIAILTGNFAGAVTVSAITSENITGLGRSTALRADTVATSDTLTYVKNAPVTRADTVATSESLTFVFSSGGSPFSSDFSSAFGGP